MRLSNDGNFYVDDEGNLYDRVSRVLGATGTTADYRWARSSRGKDLGRAVHRAAELILRGVMEKRTLLKEDSLDPAIVPYVQALRDFLRVSAFQPIASEIMLGSIYGFAGTIDAVGMLNGRLAIVDFKSGQSIDPGSEYQQCAYEVLWNENNPTKLIEAKFILHLKPTAKFSLKPVDRPAQDFLEVYDRLKAAE